MDTRIREHLIIKYGAPSMEPWPFSHGYFVPAVNSVGLVMPSMEPWPFSHGYRYTPFRIFLILNTFNGAMALQPWILLR